MVARLRRMTIHVHAFRFPCCAITLILDLACQRLEHARVPWRATGSDGVLDLSESETVVFYLT